MIDIQPDYLSGNLKTDPQVTELSSLLQRLPIYDLNKRSGTFRNENAVEMKLQNLRSLDPSYSGKGLKHDNPVEQAIWDKYANNQGALRSITQAIRDNFQGSENFIPELGDDERHKKILVEQVTYGHGTNYINNKTHS